MKGSAPPLEPLTKSTDGVNIKPVATGVKSENETTSEIHNPGQGVGDILNQVANSRAGPSPTQRIQDFRSNW